MQFQGNTKVVSRDISLRLENFRTEVLSGLRKPQRELPSKYFYDEKGAHLFELICALDEYYIPRFEATIMETCIIEVAKLIGPQVFLLEYGSGSCQKVRLLLDNLQSPIAYSPIDISRGQLIQASRELRLDYPHLELLPVCADYTNTFELPIPRQKYNRRVVYFPGSTISNFNPEPAVCFLEHLARVCGAGGGLLISVDLKKDPIVLHRAYNDSQGITAAFNLNLLERINRELGSDFMLDSFEHYAFYHPPKNRMEMHLVSLRRQEVHIGEYSTLFQKGESIWTESSYKFNFDEFEWLAAKAGFKVKHVWTDRQNWFSIQYLEYTAH
ncbi:L-histidine N(alpha)-methyltransferase [Chloroflexota bacterium]